MAISVRDLVKKLKGKNQDDMVEFIVVSINGSVVCIDVESSAKNMVDLLKMFKTK